MKKLHIFICSIFFLAVSCTQKITADIVLTNANVYTVNADQPNAEAIAIKADTIFFVGSNEEVKKYITSATEVIDCQGQFVMPGFIEGHGHIHGLGASLVNLNLMHTKSWAEIVDMVDSTVKKTKPGEWIIGRGWHQEKWDSVPGKNFLGYPYQDSLNAISPNNPVLLSHASGHSTYVNAKALGLAGVNASTPDPAGGSIVKDKQGVIVGVLEETAMSLVGKAYGDYVNKQNMEERKSNWQKSIALAEEECLKKGVTSFVDAGSSFQQVSWMLELAQTAKLKLRHWLMLRASNTDLREHANVFPIVDEGEKHLTVKAIKVALDGALGSYGAWLLEPYADRKDFLGQNTFPEDSLRKIAEFAWDKNLQLCVHAIGDRANRETINIFSEQIKKDKSKDHRWRIEHAQHVNPVEIPRFKEWNIIASMQGIHCTSDAPFVIKRLGKERAESGAYMWQSFLKAGVVVNNGTDVPVEDVDPIASYYATVTRKLKDGTTFFPDQKMTREQAIYSYTLANAFAIFQEKDKGSIQVGKLADIVILSNDLINCKDEEIMDTKVMMTIVGGKVLYKK